MGKLLPLRHDLPVSPLAIAASLLCVGVALALPKSAASDEAAGLELLGAWHLTIHYRDRASEDPDAKRWDDRLWRFEQRGSRLEWTEFPIVVFEDPRGRFVPGPNERPARTVGFWEPSEAQLAEIARGPVVNPRRARSKGLRGSRREGYRSAGGLRSDSVSVIGYSESWSIEGLDALPVFTQDATMGSGRTQDVQGRTRYVTERIVAEGRELRGRFERDGTRHGRFVLRRAGEPDVMGGSTPGAR